MNKEFDALVAQLGPLVLQWLMANSTAAGEIETVQNLDNIKALAAYRRVGGTEKTVEVPLDILTRPIDDIVELCRQATESVVDSISQTNSATAEAITAAGRANLAAELANATVTAVVEAKEEALTAAKEARDGAAEAREEAGLARTATEESKTATEESKTTTKNAGDAEAMRVEAETKRANAEGERVTAENSRVEAETKRAKAETDRVDAEETRVTAEEKRVEAETDRNTEEEKRASAETDRVDAENKRATDTADMLKDAEDAIDRMTELSDHPNYIGEDFFVYRWDEDAGAYQNTGIYLKGEGLDYTTMTDEEKARIKGMSAYEVAVEKGFVGTMEEWLVLLNGKDGDDGHTPTIGENGNWFINGADTGLHSRGDDGKDFEVPTLNVFPGEGTLSYPSGGSLVLFKIGQLARVWDAEKGDTGEYVFWQLFDVAGNKALWKLAGSGEVELPGESLFISLRCENPDFAGYLTGARVVVRWSGYNETFIWTGQPITLQIPFGTEYTIEASDVSVLGAPPVQNLVSNVGYTRRLVLEYSNKYTRIVFDKTIADPENIEGAGEGAILDIVAKMRRCLVKKTAEGQVTIAYLNNADSTKYADGTAAVLTGTEGDVMVYKPAFYYKFEAVDANRFAYYIAEQAGDGSWIHSPASLIGAYKSNNVSSKLYSRSGVAPTCSLTITNNANYAKARGAGYNIIDFEQHSMIALLFYAKYGNRNSQAILGTGNANYTAANGSTNAIGNSDTSGATTGHASFAGIEGVHGCAYEWVGGVTILDHVWTITNPDGTTRNGNAPAGTTNGYITELAAALGPYFDVIPTAVGGSATTHYADDYTRNTGSRVLARSYSSTYTDGGLSYARASYDSSDTVANIASRLAFRGVIREAQSVTAFKALPVL
jgi:hypothetical protein